MASTLDYILGGKGILPIQTAPPPIDKSLQGASASVGSRPAPRVDAPTSPSGADAVKAVADRPATMAPLSDASSNADGPMKRNLTYTEMFEAMHPHKPETAEERARREKRQRSQAVLTAVGDGISALSNLWFTSQYAPNAYAASSSAQTNARWERLRKEREAREKDYFDGYLRAISMDRAEAKEERSWRHQQKRERIADDRYDAKEARERALDELNRRYKEEQISAAQYKAEADRIKARYAEANELADLGYKNAGIQQRRAAANASAASANSSNARADYYRNGGSGGKTKHTLTIGDKTYSYGSKEDYERAVVAQAAEYGVHPYVAIPDGTHTTGLQMGKPKYKTKRKDIAQLAAEVERKASQKHAKEQEEADFSQYEVHPEDEEEDDDFSEFEM